MYFKVTHAIKWYLRIGFDLKTGNDIVEAVKGLSGTALANIESNYDDYLIDEEITNEIKNSEIKKHKTKTKIKTIKGILNLYFWK